MSKNYHVSEKQLQLEFIQNIPQRKPRFDDPEEYIKRMFGPNFEFSEKYLISQIDVRLIVKALKKRYKFEKVTNVTLKHVLYEGARINNILRMNDACFDKMV